MTTPDTYLPLVQTVKAVIHEQTCIGCVKCINACPFDSIVGAAQLMHTVLVDECTGCGLCVPACPVDCITLIPTTETVPREKAHARFYARKQRLERQAYIAMHAYHDITREHAEDPAAARRAIIAEALARAEKK